MEGEREGTREGWILSLGKLDGTGKDGKKLGELDETKLGICDAVTREHVPHVTRQTSFAEPTPLYDSREEQIFNLTLSSFRASHLQFRKRGEESLLMGILNKKRLAGSSIQGTDDGS